MRETDCREETLGLLEIDSYATNAKHKGEVPEDEKIVLRLMQSGSNWTKAVTAKTGRTDEESPDDLCELCGVMRETKDHVWHCPALKGKARELDILLSEANPEELTRRCDKALLVR